MDGDKVRVDFEKLELELNSAVEREEKYWRENDAKMRAVTQKVASYDEFKDIVAASHLKPLGREERVDALTTNRQPWNTFAVDRNPASEIPNQEIPSQPIPSMEAERPTNVQHFNRSWRQLTNAEDRYKYLQWVGGPALYSLFRLDLGFGLLGQFLTTFLACVSSSPCNDNEPQQVLALLGILTSINRFSLTVQFLSEKEKTCCTELFGKLEELLPGCEELAHLKTLYGVL